MMSSFFYWNNQGNFSHPGFPSLKLGTQHEDDNTSSAGGSSGGLLLSIFGGFRGYGLP